MSFAGCAILTLFLKTVSVTSAAERAVDVYVGSHNITVNWTASGFDKFVVSWSDNGVRSRDLDGSTTTFTIDYLEPDSEHWLHLWGGRHDVLLYSETLRTTCDTAVPCVQRIKRTEVTESTIVIEWHLDPPDTHNHIDGYQISWMMKTGNETEALVATTNSSTSEYLITDLQPDQPYHVNLSALNHHGKGPEHISLVQTAADFCKMKSSVSGKSMAQLCVSNGKCVNQYDGAVCKCEENFSGLFCHEFKAQFCSSPVPNLSGGITPDDACRPHGKCVDTDEGALCLCDQYFTGTFCEVYNGIE